MNDDGESEPLRAFSRRITHTFHKLERNVTAIERAAPSGVGNAKALVAGTLATMAEMRAEEPTADEARMGLIESNLRTIDTALSTVIDTEVPDALISETRTLLNDIREMAAQAPEVAANLGLRTEVADFAVPEVSKVLQATKPDFLKIEGELPSALATRPTPLAISEADGGIAVDVGAPATKLRLRLRHETTGAALGAMPLRLLGLRDGQETEITSVTTNARGYLSTTIDPETLAAYDTFVVAAPGEIIPDKTENPSGDDADPQEDTDQPHNMVAIFDRADLTRRDTKERVAFVSPAQAFKWRDLLNAAAATPSTAIEAPDADDLMNDPDAFSYDVHNEDGTACIRSRADISPRSFSFTQLVRTEPSELVDISDGDEPRDRVDITSPISMDPSARRESAFGIVAGNLVHGKLITYRQYWSPAAQGLGRLLYSLPLAPREEVKIAIADWSRVERTSRQDTITANESLRADIQRDTTVQDIVVASLTDETTGTTDGEASGEATNEPSVAAYIAGGVIGGIIGGPIGAGLGLAAAHFLRPDTGSSGTSSAVEWQKGMRNIAATAVTQVSDKMVQTASSYRDMRSSTVTMAYERESERVRTRTVRNHNQNHAMTVQYYQVLAHYKMTTEVQSEREVVMIPYAIDKRIMQPLPKMSAFVRAPRTSDVGQFILRHYDTLRAITPSRYRPGLDAFNRLVHDDDEYRTIKVGATHFAIEADTLLENDIELVLKTKRGLLPMTPVDELKTRFHAGYTHLQDVTGLMLRMDKAARRRRILEEEIGSLPLGILPTSDIDRERLIGAVLTRELDRQTFTLDKFSLTALLPRHWFSTDIDEFTFKFAEGAAPKLEVSYSTPSADIAFEPLVSSQLTRLIHPKRTRQGRDYERLEEFVNWMQRQPMRILRTIWLTEDANERALRFDRFNYDEGGSLLDAIENRPVGVDGNYVAFPLANNKYVSPPIDVADLRTSRAVSVPTRGVFAEIYLSCNNATETRDITRKIDQDSVTPFAAPDIAPVSTGSRSRAVIPGQAQLPANIVNFQTPPTAPQSPMSGVLPALMSPTPFHDASHGEAAMEAARSLANTAMTVDADKQKQYVDAALEVARMAGNAAMMASGLPPVLGGGGGSSSGGGSGGAEGASALAQEAAAHIASRAQRIAAGSNLRDSDPAAIVDHLKTIGQAVETGRISPEEGQEAARNLLGVVGEDVPVLTPNALANTGSTIPTASHVDFLLLVQRDTLGKSTSNGLLRRFTKYRDPGDSRDVIEYETKNEFLAALTKYQTADAVVIHGHSDPTGLYFNGTSSSSDFKPLADLIVSKKLTPVQTKSLEFQSCNVGLNIGSTAPFAKLLGSPPVTAYTYWLGTWSASVEFPLAGPGAMTDANILKEIEKTKSLEKFFFNYTHDEVVAAVTSTLAEYRASKKSKLKVTLYFRFASESGNPNIASKTNLTDYVKAVESAASAKIITPARDSKWYAVSYEDAKSMHKKFREVGGKYPFENGEYRMVVMQP